METNTLLLLLGSALAMLAVVWCTVRGATRRQLVVDRNQLEADVAELGRRNDELERRERELVDAAQSSRLRALSTLAAGVAHEINTPIGSVNANADVVRSAVRRLQQHLERCDCGEGDARLQRALRALDDALPATEQAIARVGEIVGGLKALAHLDRAVRAPVALHDGINSALNLLRHRLPEGAEVVAEYGELPPVLCDSERINQLFLNVLCNAVQAIGVGGRISITTRADRRHAYVMISDDGPGIAEQDLPRVFEPGYTTRGVGVGAGLGLAIAHRVAEDHRGKITVRSVAGEGTTVAVKLPLHPHHPRGDDALALSAPCALPPAGSAAEAREAPIGG